MTLLPGTTVGRYQILEPLGQGGMATVYKAFQPSLQREVALKVLRPGYAQDAEFRERFEREAIAIAKLRHPHIVQVFDFEVAASGEFVLAMEYLDGGTLKDRLAKLASQGQRLDRTDALRIIWEVADALTYAHRTGIVHRDVKPANVMLAEPRDRAVVTDFGIARILGATSHTQTGVGIGTPEYMAPEQGQGTHVDHRADIYSLGAMAYEIVTGRVPYIADTPLAVVLAHIKDPLPLPSSVDPTIGPGVERALLRALAKDPDARFDSAIAFAEALKAGLAEDSAGGTMPTILVPAGAASATTRATRRAPVVRAPFRVPRVIAERPLVAAAIGIAAVIAIGGGALYAGSSSGVTDAEVAASAQPSVASAAVRPAVIGQATARPAASLPPLTAIPTPQSTAAGRGDAGSGPIAAAPTSLPVLAPLTPIPTLAPLAPIPVTPSPTPKFAVPPKGKLLFEAKLDGTLIALRSAPTKFGDPAGSDYQIVPGAIALSVLKDTPTGADLTFVRAQWSSMAMQSYVWEFDLEFAANSRSFLDITFRSVTAAALRLRLDASQQNMQLRYVTFDSTGKATSQNFGPSVGLSNLQSGRSFTLAMVAEATRFTVYVDQKQVLQASDTRMPDGDRSPYLDLLFRVGTVRVTGARFYALP